MSTGKGPEVEGQGPITEECGLCPQEPLEAPGGSVKGSSLCFPLGPRGLQTEQVPTSLQARLWSPRHCLPQLCC